jgi:hypothetical protein
MLELLLITSIVMMVFESGWWDEIDEMVSSRWKFHHLPKVFVCQFCQTFWLSLIYLLIVGKGLILGVFLALIAANVGEVLLPFFKLIKSTVMKGIEWLMKKIY